MSLFENHTVRSGPGQGSQNWTLVWVRTRVNCGNPRLGLNQPHHLRAESGVHVASALAQFSVLYSLLLSLNLLFYHVLLFRGLVFIFFNTYLSVHFGLSTQ